MAAEWLAGLADAVTTLQHRDKPPVPPAPPAAAAALAPTQEGELVPLQAGGGGERKGGAAVARSPSRGEGMIKAGT